MHYGKENYAMFIDDVLVGDCEVDLDFTSLELRAELYYRDKNIIGFYDGFPLEPIINKGMYTVTGRLKLNYTQADLSYEITKMIDLNKYRDIKILMGWRN